MRTFRCSVHTARVSIVVSKMKGLQRRSDGELHTVEVFGPQGIHDWVKSFELLTTALVGFEAVSLGALLGYQGHTHRTS